MADGTSASSKPAGDAKGLGKKLDTDNTTKLDTSKDVQDKPEDEGEDDSHLVKPEVSYDAMTTNVTFKATKLEHMDGNMAVVTTSAGSLIVPGNSFANGELAPEFDGDDEQDVVVTAAYARSQSLV